jgi:hypothetical protein
LFLYRPEAHHPFYSFFFRSYFFSQGLEALTN